MYYTSIYNRRSRYTQPTHGHERYKYTFEELGKNLGKCIEVEIGIDWCDGEPRSWDYPGSPGSVEFCDFKILGFSNDDSDITLSNGWQEDLEKIVKNMIEKKWEDIAIEFSESFYDGSE